MSRLSTQDHERIRQAVEQYGRGLRGENSGTQDEAYKKGDDQRRLIGRIEAATKKERPHGRDH